MSRKTLESIAEILIGISCVGCFVNTVLFIWFHDVIFGKLALIELTSIAFILVMYGLFIYKEEEQ